MFTKRISRPYFAATLALAVSGAGGGAVFVRPAQAQGSVVTSFEKIAEGGNGASGFLYREVGLASISQTGRVGFAGQNASRFTGIYTTPGGSIFTTIGDPSAFGGNTPSALSINTSGTVAFAVLDNGIGMKKVYAGSGGALTWISDPATAPGLPNFSTANRLTFPTINDAGAVAYGVTSFNTSTNQNTEIIGVAQGGAFTSSIPIPTPGSFNGVPFNNFADADINNVGQIAFMFNSTSNQGYVYRRNSNGTFTNIASLIQPQTTIGLNDNGFVTFTGLNGTSLLVGNGITTTTIGTAATLDPVSGLALGGYANFAGGSADYISLNNLNQVAFQGGGVGVGAAPRGIYVGDGKSIITVAQVGNALFGSTITSVALSSQAINDAGQVVFTATLADGRTEIVRGTLPGAAAASAPEPGTLALLALAGLPFAGVAVRRRRKA